MTRKRKPREPKWITRARKALDEVEKMDPNDPSLAPFKTKNWLDKGWPALRQILLDGTIIDPVGDRIRKEGDK
jgi:hypothetical protein